MNLTSDELRSWRNTYADTLLSSQRIEMDDVIFSKTGTGSIAFHYKNGHGLVFSDNGYLGEQPDGRNYYPLLKLSVSYSQESRFNPSFEPNLAAAVSAIKQSWDKFTK